jgi:hypothetical protein
MPVIYLIVILFVSSFHNTFEEWDGVMQYFAGKEIMTGFGYNGWTSHFWPPLYALLIGFGSLFVSGFQVAKTVSIISGVVVLFITYHFAFELTGSKKIGLLTQLFLFINPLFFRSTLQAENHMLDTMFFVSALFLLLKIIKNENINAIQFLYLGIITGFACLSRYTSYPLVPIIVISIFIFIERRRIFKIFTVFSVGFIMISLPWWAYNTVINGFPLHTWQYLNIGYGVYPNGFEWLWDAQSNFGGITDIIITYPILYIKNFVENIFSSSILIVKEAGILLPFIYPAIFDSFISINYKSWLILFGEFFFFVLLVSQAYVFEEVFLSWIVVFTVLSVMFLVRYITISQKKYKFIEKYHLGTVVIIFLFISGLTITSWQISSYISGDDFDGGQLAGNSEVTLALIEHDPEINKKYLMSENPARAYYAGSNWLMFPEYYEGTISELVEYKNIHKRIREYAPKYPSYTEISSLKADYLIYDDWQRRFIPQFSFLLEKNSNEVPTNFNLIYWSSEVAVYEIIWQ